MSKTLLITIDALRADHIGQYGYSRDTMPELDTLLNDGTLYTNAFSNGTNSRDSIPSFLTSKHRGYRYIEEGPTIATRLSESNIQSAAFHSNTFLANISESIHGFAEVEDYGVANSSRESEKPSPTEAAYERLLKLGRYMLSGSDTMKRLRDMIVPQEIIHNFTYYVDAERITEDLINWLRTNQEEDFFLWAHYMDPHRPYGIDLDSPEYFDGKLSNSQIKSMMAVAGSSPSELNESEVEQMIDLYDSDIRYTSKQLGLLFEHINQIDLWDELNIILSADHGEEFGEHGQYFHKNLPYDELINVPLITKFNKRSRSINGKNGEMRQLLDISPTILDIHSGLTESDCKGSSLYKEPNSHVITTGALSSENFVVSVRNSKWKLIVSGGESLLYDLEADPDERTPVDKGSKKKELFSLLPEGLLSANSSTGLKTNDEAVEERLRGLGYIE